MKQYCIDVETLDVESTCIVLSAAICWFESGDETTTYEEYVDRTLYIKFDIKEQLALGRSKSESTIEWWKKQGDLIKKLCLYPSPKDISIVDGIQSIKNYINETGGSEQSFMWARGTLDQTSLESLCRWKQIEPFATYNQWMDVRTAIRLTKDTSSWTGYCDVPNFDYSKLSKHNPIDDIIIDILMLTRGV